MLHETYGLFLGAVLLGAVHGIEPGHGWPVAASYAMDKTNKWVHGTAASLTIGIGHLVSSIAMVAAFFYAKSYFRLTQVNEPITVFGEVQIGGPVSLVAGSLLIALGVREYLGGHSHRTEAGHGHEHETGEEHDHSHGEEHADEHGRGHEEEHEHEHGHEHGDSEARQHIDSEEDGSLLRSVKKSVPYVGGHSHTHQDLDEAADRGLFGIAWFAFVLGFAHEEEFEIIALCAGSNRCLELMTVYALTVIGGIVGLTLLLIGGYHRYEERVERYTPYLPVFSAGVLFVMGIGFILGLF